MCKQVHRKSSQVSQVGTKLGGKSGSVGLGPEGGNLTNNQKTWEKKTYRKKIKGAGKEKRGWGRCGGALKEGHLPNQGKHEGVKKKKKRAESQNRRSRNAVPQTGCKTHGGHKKKLYRSLQPLATFKLLSPNTRLKTERRKKVTD